MQNGVAYEVPTLLVCLLRARLLVLGSASTKAQSSNALFGARTESAWASGNRTLSEMKQSIFQDGVCSVAAFGMPAKQG